MQVGEMRPEVRRFVDAFAWGVARLHRDDWQEVLRDDGGLISGHLIIIGLF